MKGEQMDFQELEILVLAALLHDIGKFAQRADEPKSREMEGEYCPADKGHSTHIHVLYTDHFIEQVLPLPKELDDGKTRSRLARLASSHHKPGADNLMEQALSVADQLSAGTDRKSGEESEGGYKTARLVSIFEQISFGGPRPLEDLQKGLCYKLAPLAEEPFPVPLETARDTDYAALFERFRKGLENLPLDMGVVHYTTSLISLLEEYTWCIPSSTYKSLADISLFDHAITTAAIAQVLAVYHADQGGDPGQGAETITKFILVGGDLSGIQRYIFELDKSHGSGVAKLFRARSFFLQALTRSVVMELLQRIHLLPVARIMDAGGRFILLLPATETVSSVLQAFELDVQRYFFERFRGELSLSLSWSTSLMESDFRLERFQQHLDAFNDALESRKLQKFDQLFATGHNPVIDLDYGAYRDGDCPMCHIRPVDRETSARNRGAYGVEVDLCWECAEQIERIGTRLPRCQYLIFERADSGGIKLFGGINLQLEESVDPTHHRQAIEIVAISQRGRFTYQPIATHLPTIHEQDLAVWQACGELTTDSDGYLWLDDERLAVGEPKTFNLLARSAREITPDGKPTGRSFLGAIKADVDNLGMIFSIGLQDRLSISRFASLSRMLNHFFSDDLVGWIKTDYPDLYVVFAGGDDLFMIGPWRQMVEFAKALNERFKQFVARRPQITLSAGVAVTKPALPVHAIAAQAEEQLEHAKSHHGKNAINLFSTTAGWDDFASLLEKGDWLHALIRDGQVPRGLGSRLLYYGGERLAFLAGDIKRGIYLSHMQYDFARNITEKTVNDPRERAAILAIQQDEFLLDHIRLPVSWALYRLRKDT
ncbi:MAG: type III-A CRISPR-associated protein Cas10/Csm1 [Desulfosarcina sp.]|nr:type III-A CRISPR-associated protein Cas10/Csm1 [Desulfosarcina sp.]MBC2744860.1 type III-A CRISPR-associated protein Cas10/Csm1 [Desulfosarcina sp.]MBC2767768.1 type III-A CRISPR-associated protein Cas10/Csm1 [Desulfosarcina sp.]